MTSTRPVAQGFTPDPCFRHLDLAVASPVSRVGSVDHDSSSDDDDSDDDDDADLDSSFEGDGGTCGVPSLDHPRHVISPRLSLCAAPTRRLTALPSNRVGRGRPTVLLDSVTAIAVCLQAAVSLNSTDVVGCFATPSSPPPDIATSSQHLIPDLLHFTVVSKSTSAAASRVGLRFDVGSVVSGVTVYQDPSAAPARCDVTALAAFQALAELALTKSTALLSTMLSSGGLWYLLWTVLQGSPSDTSMYARVQGPRVVVCKKLCVYLAGFVLPPFDACAWSYVQSKA